MDFQCNLVCNYKSGYDCALCTQHSIRKYRVDMDFGIFDWHKLYYSDILRSQHIPVGMPEHFQHNQANTNKSPRHYFLGTGYLDRMVKDSRDSLVFVQLLYLNRRAFLEYLD